MTTHESDEDRQENPRSTAGFELAMTMDAPWLSDLMADLHWVRTGKPLDPAFPGWAEDDAESQPLTGNDVARIDPAVQEAANQVSQLMSDAIYTLGGLIEAKDAFYKTFQDAKYREEKLGGIDMSDLPIQLFS